MTAGSQSRRDVPRSILDDSPAINGILAQVIRHDARSVGRAEAAIQDSHKQVLRGVQPPQFGQVGFDQGEVVLVGLRLEGVPPDRNQETPDGRVVAKLLDREQLLIEGGPAVRSSCNGRDATWCPGRLQSPRPTVHTLRLRQRAPLS